MCECVHVTASKAGSNKNWKSNEKVIRDVKQAYTRSASLTHAYKQTHESQYTNKQQGKKKSWRQARNYCAESGRSKRRGEVKETRSLGQDTQWKRHCTRDENWQYKRTLAGNSLACIRACFCVCMERTKQVSWCGEEKKEKRRKLIQRKLKSNEGDQTPSSLKKKKRQKQTQRSSAKNERKKKELQGYVANSHLEQTA